MEKSLIIFKPDCMEKNMVGTVLERFQKEGFEIIASKMMKLDHQILKVHYAHIADKPFFPEIDAFMSSRPVLVMALQGKGIVNRIREILGATDPAEAGEGTIRNKYGADKMRNIAHASDSDEAAQQEIKRFFKQEEVFVSAAA